MQTLQKSYASLLKKSWLIVEQIYFLRRSRGKNEKNWRFFRVLIISKIAHRGKAISRLDCRHQIVIFFDAQHTHIFYACRKPWELFRQFLHDHNTINRVDRFISEVNASLLPLKAVFFHELANIAIGVLAAVV